MGNRAAHSASRFHLTANDIVKECSNGTLVESRHILVTGATSGIGVETSRALACAGANVYLMGRDEAKLNNVTQAIQEELRSQQPSAGGSVRGVLCDLNSLASVKKFAQDFVSESAPLNVLILNAGIMPFHFGQTVDGLEQTIGVNHIAHAYLTQLLMPKLLANAPARIVVVASKLHIGPAMNYDALNRMSSTVTNAKKGWSIFRSYQQSKLANVLFARGLASRFRDQQITAYSLHPGVIKTNLGGQIPLGGEVKTFLTNKTVAEGAATTVYCALKPNLEGDTGRYFDDSAVTNHADKWSDADINAFWDWTEKVIRERTANL